MDVNKTTDQVTLTTLTAAVRCPICQTEIVAEIRVYGKTDSAQGDLEHKIKANLVMHLQGMDCFT